MTTPDPPQPFATFAELATYWRPLTEAEQARATDLLKRASRRIRELPGSADFNPDTCNDIVLDMVKRAMIGGGGVSSGTQAMADITATQTYVNPVGNLYVTSEEKTRLYGYSPPTFSLTPTSNAHVPHQRWNRQPSRQHHHGADCDACP